MAGGVQYWLSNKVIRDRVERSIQSKPSLLAIQNAVCQEPFRLQALLRLTPINPAVVSYLLGAAGVKFLNFLIACFAMFPLLFLEVYFGHVGKEATKLSGGGNSSQMHHFAIFGILISGIVVMITISRIARKAIMEAVTENQTSIPNKID